MPFINLLLLNFIIFNSISAISAKEINSLNIEIENFNPEIKVLQYNVNKNPIAQNFEKYKWKNRKEKIKKLILETNCDIACLQEMRELPDEQSDNIFLSSINGYRFFLWYKSPILNFAFGQAILYKADKFFPLTSFPLWLSDTPKLFSEKYNSVKQDFSFDSMIVCAKFAHIKDNKIVNNVKPFWIFNVHFPTPEILNKKACFKLLEIVKNITKEDPFLICGDFNFFPDKNGDKHRQILTNQLIDIGKDAKTLSGKKIEGTFIGYDYDNFKADLNNLISRLDHIFGSKTITKIDDAILYIKTMENNEPEEFTRRDYPSDHLPLLAKIKLY